MSTLTASSSNSLDTPTIQSNNNHSAGKHALEILQLTGDILLVLLQFWFAVGEAIFRLFVPVPLKSVKGEIVVITGAGHGIGKELALLYAAEGATVVCWDINQKGNLETIQEIAKLGYPKAHAYECNVANREEVIETGKIVQREVGDVSILINNAGIMPCHPFVEHTTDEFERIMNINVMAHYWTLQAFLPTMLKNNHGHIVAISSVAGLMGVKYLVPYCASKFAVRGMMEALYQDLRTDPKCQIKLTTIYPYAVDTGLCKKPKIKFESVLSLLNPRSVAEHIVKSQKGELHETSFPRHFLSVAYYSRLFPVKALIRVSDFLDTYIDSDLS